MYTIGMIEDKLAEASSVMLSLVTNSNEIDENSFQLYALAQNENFRDELYEKLKEDVIENHIQGLIVDYKLDTLKEVVEGIEIANYMHSLVPEFPVVILTDYPEKGKENDKADPDKVYAKSIFMKPDADLTKEMVYNIIRNLERYTKRRSELELKRHMLLENLINRNDNYDEVYGGLISVESELSKYVPLNMTAIDKAYDTTEMDEALQLLKEYKTLLE